jgi:phosphatidate phosphatase LPIN
LYLTSRAIGQANMTRGYIQNLRQNDNTRLPDGPVIMSPDRLIESFKREVILRRPHEFKILALQDIRMLFALDHNPFYAGFGNRITVSVVYLSL